LTKHTDHQQQVVAQSILVARLQKFQGAETPFVFHQDQAATNLGHLEVLGYQVAQVP